MKESGSGGNPANAGANGLRGDRIAIVNSGLRTKMPMVCGAMILTVFDTQGMFPMLNCVLERKASVTMP